MRVIRCFKNRRVKSQIPSTKLQIILNIQFPMTKTFGCYEPFGSETTDCEPFGCEFRVERLPSPEPVEGSYAPFGFLVIVICLIFGICYLEFSLLRQ
jgi:hypothetical protein